MHFNNNKYLLIFYLILLINIGILCFNQIIDIEQLNQSESILNIVSPSVSSLKQYEGTFDIWFIVLNNLKQAEDIFRALLPLFVVLLIFGWNASQTEKQLIEDRLLRHKEALEKEKQNIWVSLVHTYNNWLNLGNIIIKGIYKQPLGSEQGLGRVNDYPLSNYDIRPSVDTSILYDDLYQEISDFKQDYNSNNIAMIYFNDVRIKPYISRLQNHVHISGLDVDKIILEENTIKSNAIARKDLLEIWITRQILILAHIELGLVKYNVAQRDIQNNIFIPSYYAVETVKRVINFSIEDLPPDKVDNLFKQIHARCKNKVFGTIPDK